MMHSDSFSSSSGIPPYLRARARRSYSPLEGEQQDERGSGARYLLRRVVGAIGVCVAFGAAVSSNSRWITRSSTDQRLQTGGSSYRGVFEDFEVSLAGRTDFVFVGVSVLIYRRDARACSPRPRVPRTAPRGSKGFNSTEKVPSRLFRRVK